MIALVVGCAQVSVLAASWLRLPDTRTRRGVTQILRAWVSVRAFHGSALADAVVACVAGAGVAVIAVRVA